MYRENPGSFWAKATPLNTAQLKLSRLGRKPELAADGDLKTAAEALEHCRDVLRHMAGAPLQPDRLDLEIVDVDEIVSQVCSSIALEHEEIGIYIHTHGRAPRRALIPAVAFSQALLNLIDNAIEAGNGEQPVEVIIDNPDGHTEVAVRFSSVLAMAIASAYLVMIAKRLSRISRVLFSYQRNPF